jgi:hypothetical protein
MNSCVKGGLPVTRLLFLLSLSVGLAACGQTPPSDREPDGASAARPAAAGIAGGVVFGIMMGMMGMLTLIGQMVGFPNPLAGFAVHLMISAVIGGIFAAVVGDRLTGTPAGLGYGAAYGAVWWFIGPLTLMPLLMGMGLGANWNGTAVVGMLPSLMGHVIYGLILGAVYAWLTRRSGAVPSRARPAAGRA